jgi:hypothetical protein
MEHAGMSDDLAERCISLGRVLEEQWLLDAGHEIERLREAAQFAHKAISTYRVMYPSRMTGALDHAKEKLREALGDE